MSELLELPAGSAVLLCICIGLALAFEFVNGFHDTANAVATVIYTKALRPNTAVVLSGVMNFVGVMVGGLAVALAIMKLLPAERLVAGEGVPMVMALLMAAIMWNLGTWYLGLPASSSHTLIGSILGVGLASATGVNWEKARDIGLSLLISPLAGFVLAAGVYLLIKKFAKDRRLVEPPDANKPPPIATRAVLVGTCSAVSFAHGSNDGQKGVGLIMLILIGLLPGAFALDGTQPTAQAATAVAWLDGAPGTEQLHPDLVALKTTFVAHPNVSDIPKDERFDIRQKLKRLDKELGAVGKTLPAQSAATLEAHRKTLRGLTDYAPTWVIAAIALALGLGTMIGWKRIVVTIGERIGKSHLTYGQGMAAELVAATAIGVASSAGLPVSTTHVLSSGVAGTMVAQRSGLNVGTVRNIALAWVLTLPAAMAMSAGLFLVLRKFF